MVAKSGVKLIFAPDTEVALRYLESLVNTRPGRQSPEALTSVQALLDQMDGWGWTGAMPSRVEDLEQVIAVRERLHGLWGASTEQSVEIVNALLADGQALPQLVIHEPYGWHIHGTPSDAPVARRIAVEAGFAFVDVIRTDSLERLRRCERDDCAHVLVDLTKNHSRKFCDTVCANRAHAAAYRARKATD